MEHIVIAKLFKNGSSQAVRLPKEFRFEGDEVIIYREGNRVIIQPKKSKWDEFFFSGKRVSKDFMQGRKDAPPQKRELF
jgi:antitoxin VapB